jgi:hypothetical protein
LKEREDLGEVFCASKRGGTWEEGVFIIGVIEKRVWDME